VGIAAHLLLPALFDGLYVVVEQSSNDGDHVCFNDSCAHILRASDADVDDALKGKVPLPHVHGVLASALFQYADQAFDTAIDGEDVAYAGGGGGEVGEIVERVYERQRGGAVESATVVEGRGDADGCLVRIWYAEIVLPHDCCSGGDSRGWLLSASNVSLRVCESRQNDK